MKPRIPLSYCTADNPRCWKRFVRYHTLNSTMRFHDFLWQEYRAEYVQRLDEIYIEFETVEYLTMFKLQWG